MIIHEYQQRVVDEKTELDDKLVKLIAFFDNPVFAQLPQAEQGRLRRQSSIMTDYSVVLAERIEAF